MAAPRKRLHPFSWTESAMRPPQSTLAAAAVQQLFARWLAPVLGPWPAARRCTAPGRPAPRAHRRRPPLCRGARGRAGGSLATPPPRPPPRVRPRAPPAGAPGARLTPPPPPPPPPAAPRRKNLNRMTFALV